MNKKLITLLKKIYSHENGFYNSALNRHDHKIPENISEDDIKLLEQHSLAPNNFETFTHDNALDRLLSYKHSSVNIELATSLFLKGITGEFPRGRQTLTSYLYIKNLKEHAFQGKDICEVCGLPKEKTLDKTDVLNTYYLGHSWNELPLHFLIELDEVSTFQKPEIGNKEQKSLYQLLKAIIEAPDDETPSQLEKRLAKMKVLPKTDKYKRYGILQTLAECGIILNTISSNLYDEFATQKMRWDEGQKLTTSHRSDIILPFGGWKGNLGINKKRVKEIFGLGID